MQNLGNFGLAGGLCYAPCPAQKMVKAKSKPNIVQLQVLTWAAVLLLIFFSMLPMDGWLKSLIYTAVNTSCYAIIIYGNILVLYPAFYQKRKLALYTITVVIFLTAIGIFRGYASLTLYQHFSLIKKTPVSLPVLLGYIPGGVLIYVLSLVFRISIAYFTLKRQAEEILLQKSQAELDLLKSQVQPHFLFNALNSIYYRVYKVDPPSAALIERLSDIMRYFVDESPKDKVTVASEVAFIENYMELERNRIRHGAIIEFDKNYSPGLNIPPMLLMPFVENIFKHGIDKSLTKNQVQISLTQLDGYLIFKTRNRKVDPALSGHAGGFGLINLDKRLRMLYGGAFELNINDDGNWYTTLLKIPVS